MLPRRSRPRLYQRGKDPPTLVLHLQLGWNVVSAQDMGGATGAKIRKGSTQRPLLTKYAWDDPAVTWERGFK
ncbi:hypothetical protein NDU88_006044 [Pleurodeles waltl]|uniref:Uncharacterized protein n=1 Tax=Pleurodeles waltl TaxID=8319 RepID=A0AAV7WX07_PLEWA|nr:hypothetical protein NDU88_006044 [Pleurodeles waltl]